MTAIDYWKFVIRQANKAFSRKQLPLAETLYRQAIQILLLNEQLHDVTDVTDAADDPATLKVICFSISVQNLAETYAIQRRWRRCVSILNRGLQQLEQAQLRLPAEHPAAVALLREGCHLRRELCRFSQLQHQCTSKKASQPAGLRVQMQSLSFH